MKNNNIKLGLFGLLWGSLLAMANAANIAYVPKTGPGESAGAGKPWPTHRFVVHGDCITDKLTGLMWPRNAALLGSGYWSSSLASGSMQYKIAQMNTNSTAPGYHLCGYSDWRLPNLNELRSLINYSALRNGSSPAVWLNSNGFSNFQHAIYYSSTWIGRDGAAATVTFSSGQSNSITYADNPANSAHFLPVRGGR
jgi:hypothetical protein